MFKINRIFASDICAGGNILQQAEIPVFHPAGSSTASRHGVVFAVNGTCKTTLISFLLNTFYPDKKRFVQHLQSGGDKTLEQYLAPGRPALVLVEMALPGEGRLFEGQIQERLVIGQLLYRYNDGSKPLTRIFFQAHSPKFFDEIRDAWPGLGKAPAPLAASREYLGPRVTATEVQKDWLKRLEDIGLDPWLMNRQIDFARSEGGIKDAFRFRSEADFLSFFLGCVTDMEFAEKLRKATLTSMGKMQDLPRKKERLGAIVALQTRLQDFETIAGRWRTARQERNQWGRAMEEAAFLIGKTLPRATEELRTAQDRLGHTQTEQKKAKTDLKILKANRIRARAFVQEMEETRLKAGITEINQTMAGIKEEVNGVKAAHIMAELDLTTQRFRDKEAAMATSGKELTPLREKVLERAGAYHACIANVRNGTGTALATARQEKAAAAKEIKSRKKTISQVNRETQGLEKQIQDWTTKLDMAAQARQHLGKEPQEGPDQVKQRLEQALEQNRRDLNQNREKRQDLKANMAEETRTRDSLMAQKAKDQARLNAAHDARAKEARQRQALLADAHIRKVVGSDQFDPTNAAHGSALSQAMERSNRKLQKAEANVRALAQELVHLDETRSLAVDGEIWKLIAHYREQGIPPHGIRAYPEYLAAQELGPEATAQFIHRDPARFTGILAMTPQALENIMALGAPAWLKRPVVVSLPEEEIQAVEELPHRCILPTDPTLYTREGADRFKERITAEKQRAEADIREQMQTLADLRRSADALAAYRRDFPDSPAVKALETQVTLAAQALEKTDTAIAQARERMATLQDRLNTAQDRNGELQGRQGELKGELAQVKNWLDQYGEWESWHGRIRENQKKIQLKEREILDLEEDLQALDQVAQAAGQRIPALEKDLERLDELAREVPLPPDFDETAPGEPHEMDPSRLKTLYEQAREDLKQMTSQLGVAALEQEIQGLGRKLADLTGRLERFRADHAHGPDKAESWARRSAADRDREISSLENRMEKEREKRSRTQARAELAAAEKEKALIQLRELKKKGIQPQLTTRELEALSPEAVALSLETDLEHRKRDLENRLETLEHDLGQCRKALKAVEAWQARLEKLEARTGDVPQTPPPELGSDWPNLAHPQDRLAHCSEMEARIKTLAQDQKAADQRTRTLERERNLKFEDLTARILDPKLGKAIPALVDGIREHDAQSLGERCTELISHCTGIATTLEGDLERSKTLMATHIQLLMEHAKDCHQKLMSATRVMIPEQVFTYGGNPILKATLRLNFDRSGRAYVEALEHWMEERIQTGFCPQVNPAQGNGLGSDLLYRLLAVETGKQFNIRLLKCDDTARNYEPVGRDMGSGGEALTTSVLLYALLVSMRRKRFKGGATPMPGFLILDNPLGVCNRPAFLDAQLKVAHALGVQCIYFTGINDTGSIELFEHRIVIRRAGCRITLDGRPYEKLETVQIHMEE